MIYCALLCEYSTSTEPIGFVTWYFHTTRYHGPLRWDMHYSPWGDLTLWAWALIGDTLGRRNY